MGRRNCGKCGVGFLGDSWFCESCLAEVETDAGPACACGQPAVTQVKDAFGGFSLCQACASESDLSWAAEHGATRSVA